MKRRPVVDRLLVGVVALLFVAGIVVSSLGGSGLPREASVASSEAEGRRALFLVLEELGLEPRSWRGAPAALPAGEHVLWMAGPPVDLGLTGGETEMLSGSDADPGLLADPRHPAHYGEFVRAGGTLVLPWSDDPIHWLRTDCGLEVPDWEPCDLSQERLEVELDTGELLEVVFDPDAPALAARSAEEREAPPSWDAREHDRRGWHDLASARDGRPFASWVAVVHGRVVFVADDAFARNDLLGAGDNGLLALRLVEALERGGELYFDEFAVGRWIPTRKAQLLLLPGVLEVGYHLLAALLLFVLLHAWAREFPRDPRPAPLDPRLRVGSQARLYERAGRHDLLGHELRLGTLRRLGRRLGAGGDLRRLGEETTPDALAELARELGARSRRPELWRRAFTSPPPASARELEALGVALEQLEKSVAPGASPENTGRPAHAPDPGPAGDEDPSPSRRT